MLLRFHLKQSALEIASFAEKAYFEVGLTMEQKFVFLSKGELIDEQFRNFVILREPTSLGELKLVLAAYGESCEWVQHMERVTAPNRTQDGRALHKLEEHSRVKVLHLADNSNTMHM